MPINDNEKQFESDIEFDLLNQGYRQIKPTEYNATNAVFPEILAEFISNSQPKEWARFEQESIKAQNNISFAGFSIEKNDHAFTIIPWADSFHCYLAH